MPCRLGTPRRWPCVRPTKIFSPLSRLTYSASITVNPPPPAEPTNAVARLLARSLERWRERRDVFFALYRFNVRFRACKGAYHSFPSSFPRSTQSPLLVVRKATCSFLALFDTRMGLCLPNACPYFGQCLLPLSLSPLRSLTRSFQTAPSPFVSYAACLPLALARAPSRTLRNGLGQQINKMCSITIAVGKERRMPPRAQCVTGSI